MKIVLVTSITPTEDNFNGPSALMFHLLKNRSKDISLSIFTTNTNKVPDKNISKCSKLLGCEIEQFRNSLFSKIFEKQKLYTLMAKIRKIPDVPSRYMESLPTSILAKIREIAPDIIWIYPHGCLGYMKQLSNYRLIVTGPDCASLHLSRALRDPFVLQKEKTINLHWNELVLNYEKVLAERGIFVHLVGQTDVDYFNCLSPQKNAMFFPHPHYNVIDKSIQLSNKSKLKVVISGKPDIYTHTDVNEFVHLMLVCKDKVLMEKFEYTFLGKYWTSYVQKLADAGYSVKQIDWVDNYIEDLAKYDVQIFPISVGSGTKGKVLDALSTGLLSIGSKYAFENIAIENGKSCCIYDHCMEILEYLKDIVANPVKYEAVAEMGRTNIRKYHNPKMIMTNMLKYLETGNCDIDNRVYYHLSLK